MVHGVSSNNQVEAQVCNVLDFVILQTMYESMYTDSRISENFPIIYKIHGWMMCRQWFMDECIVDGSREYVYLYFMDETAVGDKYHRNLTAMQRRLPYTSC